MGVDTPSNIVELQTSLAALLSMLGSYKLVLSIVEGGTAFLDRVATVQGRLIRLAKDHDLKLQLYFTADASETEVRRLSWTDSTSIDYGIFGTHRSLYVSKLLTSSELRRCQFNRGI